MSASSAPRLERSLRLHVQGDWGGANLHKVWGWLSQQVVNRSGPHTRVAIWNGQGWADAPRAVGRAEVDLALATPACFVPMALEGRGMFAAESFPFLCSLGSLPQWDRIVLAVRRDVGVQTFKDIRRQRPALHIATCPDDGISFIGFAARRMLEAEGVGAEHILEWGGSFIEHGHPRPTFAEVESGRANALLQEAIMLPAWAELIERQDLVLIPMSDAASERLEADYGMPRAEIPAGYFSGQDRAVQAVDFSDFLVICRPDLPDDVAHLITWCMGETRQMLERQYAHVPVRHSPVTYPLDPARMARTPIPLHPGAEAYYRSVGALEPGSGPS